MGSWFARLLVAGKNRGGSLKNIKDAIQAYLETVEELSKNKKSRYVEVG